MFQVTTATTQLTTVTEVQLLQTAITKLMFAVGLTAAQKITATMTTATAVSTLQTAITGLPILQGLMSTQKLQTKQKSTATMTTAPTKTIAAKLQAVTLLRTTAEQKLMTTVATVPMITAQILARQEIQTVTSALTILKVKLSTTALTTAITITATMTAVTMITAFTTQM